MIEDSTLGGYVRVHERPPAFEGSDGRSYSVSVFVDHPADPAGRYGAALLFVRWSPGGDRPDGHLESDVLGYGATAEQATAVVNTLSLHDVKAHLEEAISRRGTLEW